MLEIVLVRTTNFLILECSPEYYKTNQTIYSGIGPKIKPWKNLENSAEILNVHSSLFTFSKWQRANLVIICIQGNYCRDKRNTMSLFS